MSPRPNLGAELDRRLRHSLDAAACIVDAADMRPYLTDWRGLYNGEAIMVVRPRTTAEVAKIVRECAELQVAIVPQGGNTSLVGGSVPADTADCIVLSMGRLNTIREIDPLDHSITVDAGCVLTDIQAAAAEAGLLFPLSLGAEGSCQIGGNVATNAGGVHVLRYGNCRDLVLGLEVVLADGTVWDGLRKLRKDNTGYDVKQFFIGSEGTLGVITGAVLKLFSLPRETVTCLVAVREAQAALEVFKSLRADSGECVSAFELIPRFGIDLAIKHIPGIKNPIAGDYQHYALIELSSSRLHAGLSELLQARLEMELKTGTILDAVIASSESQVQELWRLREAIVEAQKAEGTQVKHDISVSTSQVPQLLEVAHAAVEAACRGARVMAFGHLGDGNLHFNVSPPIDMPASTFLEFAPALTRAVHGAVAELGGSISAEHGVGQLRRDSIAEYKSGIEIETMRRIKRALDPKGIMNPDKVVRTT